MMTAPPARIGRPLVGAFGAACAAVEAFARTLAAEVGPYEVRVVCLRSRAFQKTPTQVARDLGGCILWPGCGLIGVFARRSHQTECGRPFPSDVPHRVAKSWSAD